GSAGTAQAKKDALEKVGVRVGRTPSETARLMRSALAALGTPAAPSGPAVPSAPPAKVSLGVGEAS
ncbi:hypothetical protein AB0G15_30900, partial [Streptosporangium sp. NPDC023825]